MKQVLNQNKALKTFLIFLIVGLAFVGLALSPLGNPPQCEGNLTLNNSNCIIGANIGGGLILLLGFGIVFIGLLVLLFSFLKRAHQLNHRLQKWLLFIVISILVFIPISWVIKTGLDASNMMEKDAADFQAKYRSNFVEYKTPPKWDEVSGESSTVRYLENQSLLMYLNECEAGKSDAPYASGITYFVLSGVKDNECVLYIHEQAATAGVWDGFLRQKCQWRLDTPKDDTPIFRADPNGIEFGDFITKNCKSI